MQKFDSPAPVSAVIDIPAGRIQVIAADRSDTTVEVLPANASKSRDVKAAEQVTVLYGDGVLRIEAAPAKNRILGGDSGSVELTVHLPVGSRIEAKTAAADFRAAGRLGDVTYEGAQGTLELDETASARLSLMAGDITVGRLGGPADISTQKGDLTVTEATDGTLTLNTQSGDITVGAAHGISAALDAATTYGRINNALKNTDSTPGLTIRATTTQGNITATSN
ncbi:DUF4097 family beta strand repeat-containing protein [Streptomyces sp. NPDC005244]|uniref:DUF4097 family beta strand repeat-containing protein n=1 Tax=Streptomyces sp. NPDC005244 TaxID=3364708 RepID=UPI00367E3A67